MASSRQSGRSDQQSDIEVRGPAGRRIRGLDADQRRAQRRDLLLDSAFELIARNGYADTSIEQICQTAYVGNKAFYESFDSKEACYLALLRKITEQLQGGVVASLPESTGDPDETVRVVVAAFAHGLVDDPRVAKVTFGEASGISPNVERQRRTNRRWAAAFLEAIWEQQYGLGSGTGELDYHALAVATIGGMFDTVADWLVDDDPARPHTVDTLIGDLTAFVFVVRDGIAAHRKRS